MTKEKQGLNVQLLKYIIIDKHAISFETFLEMWARQHYFLITVTTLGV